MVSLSPGIITCSLVGTSKRSSAIIARGREGGGEEGGRRLLACCRRVFSFRCVLLVRSVLLESVAGGWAECGTQIFFSYTRF